MGTWGLLYKHSQSSVLEKIMKVLLVIALFGVAVQAEADPGFVYTVGYPHAYGLPLVYTHPVAYANNVCTNEGGAVVPCAAGVAPGSGVYNFVDAPVGLHPVVGAAPVAAAAWYSYYGRPSYYGHGYGYAHRGYYGGYAGY